MKVNQFLMYLTSEDLPTLEWYLRRRRKAKRFDPEQYSLELPGYRRRRR